MTEVVSLTTVQDFARPLGFTLLGVTPAKESDRADFIRHWLAEDKHGQMHYLAANLEKRLDPCKLVPGAKSIICVADQHPAAMNGNNASHNSPLGRIARYAWGQDYHITIRKRLHQLADALQDRYPDHEYRSAVDTAPILERDHGVRAGLGWVGKHTLLIHPRLGSYLLLGQIITTLPIDTTATQPITDHCGTCTRCIDACPTHCIKPYQLDASRCISYLTIEHRETIDPTFHEPMDNWIAGCDICQEVCPFNKHDPFEDQKSEIKNQESFPLLDVLNWTANDRRQAFTRSALKRIKLDMLKRNALIAAGNYLAQHEDRALLSRVETLANDPTEPESVRITARQVLDRLIKAWPVSSTR